MSELSLVVRNATIVDGTGRPAYTGDVGVADDRIARIGRIGENELNGAEVVEAAGRVLSPGFIDIHTHYDAQLAWDGLATPSPEHGVTTVIIGNCSVSLAPYSPGIRKLLLDVFNSVEDIAPAIISEKVAFDWETFPQYLKQLRSSGLGVNVGALVGYTMLRGVVMGDDAQKRPASPDQVTAMAGMMREASAAGAMGLSLTYGHKDPDGNFLPNVFAEKSEVKALCRAMAEGGRGMIEVAPNFMNRQDQIDIIDLLGELSVDTGVAASLDGIMHAGAGDTLWQEQIAKLEEWQRRGARVTAQLLVRPFENTVNLAGTSLGLMKLELWDKVMLRDVDARLAALRDPKRRAEMAKVADAAMALHADAIVLEGRSAATRTLVGKTIAEIAAERGSDSIHETMIAIALEDDLDVEFGVTTNYNADTEVVSEILAHPLVQPGAGDAGAHVTQFAGAGDTCYLFERYVRELGKFSVEEAVHMLTGKVAGDWGISQRGTIATGQFADLVVFDPQTIRRGRAQRVSDYPANSARWVRKPEGVGPVIVNGRVIRDEQGYRADRPGRVV